MKKVSLFLGFALMASMVFAQNTAVVNQTNDENKATVKQSGDLNGATVDQVGTKNFVTVDSKGLSNSAIVEQNGVQNGNGSIPNWGFIKQDGNANTAILKEGKIGGVTSADADGFIDQKGNDNHATLEISGQYHNFINHGITQVQEQAEKGNTAVIKQSAFNNDMDVKQTGSDNLITGTTAGSNNQFFVDQTGIKNTATVSQVGDNNGEFGYYWGNYPNARTWNVLSQTGNENVGSVLQASGSKFKMTQMGGDYNTAMISQLGNNTVTTMQNGNYNTIGGILNCVPQQVAVFANGASMDATQLGDKNKLYVSTAGSLTVVQNSTSASALALGNMIKYTQTAVGNVELTQVGDNNLIWLKNTSVAPIDADVDQTGTSNGVAMYADGFTAPATGCALFEGTHLDIDQSGTGNLLNLNSAGLNASVDVMQNGTSNLASVVQGN